MPEKNYINNNNNNKNNVFTHNNNNISDNNNENIESNAKNRDHVILIGNNYSRNENDNNNNSKSKIDGKRSANLSNGLDKRKNDNDDDNNNNDDGNDNDDNNNDNNNNNDDDNNNNNNRVGADSDENENMSESDFGSEDEEEIDPNEYKKKKEDESRTPLQRKLYYFFEEPRSKFARAFFLLLIFCVILTVVVICVESYPTILELHDKIYYGIWFPIEIFITTIFTIEYIGRFLASLNKLKFIYQPLNIIDLLSILPFYLQFVEFFPSKASIILRLLRVFRLLRILRIIRSTKYSVGLHITTRAIKRSSHQLFMVFLYFLIVFFISSALLYNFERGERFDQNDMTWYRVGTNGQLEPSPFQSVIHSFWWSILTLTTTGYGDIVPITAPGKIVAGLTMVCGVLVIALPTSIIGSNFISEWTLHKRIQFHLRLKKHNESYDAILREYHGNKEKTIDVLQNRNETMLKSIMEIQEKLADLSPPMYYRKYKNLQIKYIEAKEKIEELEAKLEKWEKISRNLESFNQGRRINRKRFNDSGVSGDSGGGTSSRDSSTLYNGNASNNNSIIFNDLLHSTDSTATYHGPRLFNWKKLSSKKSKTSLNGDGGGDDIIDNDNSNILNFRTSNKSIDRKISSLKMKLSKSLPTSSSSDNKKALINKSLIGSPIDLRHSRENVDNDNNNDYIEFLQSSSSSTGDNNEHHNNINDNNKDQKSSNDGNI